jgi:hypothetical protein
VTPGGDLPLPGDETAPLTPRKVVSGSAVLLVARGAQAVLGLGSLVLTARALRVGGYGDFATAFAASSIVGGVLSAAMSDAVVIAPDAAGALGRLTDWIWMVTLVPGGIAALAGHGPGWLLGLLASLGFLGASASSASRLARARTGGRAVSLALVQGLGSVGTLGLTALLAWAGVHRWEPYLIAYTLQPAALLLLPRPGYSDQSRPPALHDLAVGQRSSSCDLRSVPTPRERTPDWRGSLTYFP